MYNFSLKLILERYSIFYDGTFFMKDGDKIDICRMTLSVEDFKEFTKKIH